MYVSVPLEIAPTIYCVFKIQIVTGSETSISLIDMLACFVILLCHRAADARGWRGAGGSVRLRGGVVGARRKLGRLVRRQVTLPCVMPAARRGWGGGLVGGLR